MFRVFFSFQIQNLSGGELQRVALTICLGKVCFVFMKTQLIVISRISTFTQKKYIFLRFCVLC